MVLKCEMKQRDLVRYSTFREIERVSLKCDARHTMYRKSIVRDPLGVALTGTNVVAAHGRCHQQMNGMRC